MIKINNTSKWQLMGLSLMMGAVCFSPLSIWGYLAFGLVVASSTTMLIAHEQQKQS